jgi:hypothetical protein
MKTATIVTLGLIVLGIGRISAQTIPPHINFWILDPRGPTISVTAGTDPMPIGFNVLVFGGGRLFNVAKIDPFEDGCGGFALQPFQQSPEFIVFANPLMNNDPCQTYRGNILACGHIYEWIAQIRDSKVRTAPITLNLPCQ